VEIGNLVSAANKICDTEKNAYGPTLTLLRGIDAGLFPVQVNAGQVYATA